MIYPAMVVVGVLLSPTVAQANNGDLVKPGYISEYIDQTMAAFAHRDPAKIEVYAQASSTDRDDTVRGRRDDDRYRRTKLNCPPSPTGRAVGFNNNDRRRVPPGCRATISSRYGSQRDRTIELR